MNIDNLDAYDRSMFDAIISAHACGAMHEGDAVRIIERIAPSLEVPQVIATLDAAYAAYGDKNRAAFHSPN